MASSASSSAAAFAIVAFAASRAAMSAFNSFCDSRRIWGATTCRSTSRASRLTWTSQRSTSASYLPRIDLASSSRARAALTSAAATSTSFWASLTRSSSYSTVAFFVPHCSRSSGTKRSASTSPFRTLSPMSTFHFSMNAVIFG